MDIQVITDRSEAHVLLGVMDRQREHMLTVPVLRHGRHPMAATMLRNFLRACLASAANENRCIVAVSELKLADTDKDILRQFGFVSCGEIWVKLALRSVGDLEGIRNTATSLDLDVRFEPAKQAALKSIAVAAELRDAAALASIERQLWHAKVVAPEFPSFIVSIRPEWAQHFFDVELGSQLLLGLREDLHLGVEGVYYRSTENNNLTAPGRVLWYVSKGTGDGSMRVKACSQLEEVVIGKPKDLFRRFQRLGVYERRDVYTTANHDVSNEIVAFRFRMTERFIKPVEMDISNRSAFEGRLCHRAKSPIHNLRRSTDEDAPSTKMPDNHALLLSIRPRFVDSIFAGTKTVELRRVKPRVQTGDLVVVYASGTIKAMVGAFEVAGVTTAKPSSIWRRHNGGSGLTKREFDSYFAGASVGYAIRIGKSWRLETTVPLGTLHERHAGFRPPQSYHYWNRNELLLITGTRRTRS